MSKENPIYVDKLSVHESQKPIFFSLNFCEINNSLYSACKSAENLSDYEKKETADKLKKTLDYFLSIID